MQINISLLLRLHFFFLVKNKQNIWILFNLNNCFLFFPLFGQQSKTVSFSFCKIRNIRMFVWKWLIRSKSRDVDAFDMAIYA